MIFACIYSFITFWLWALAFGNLKNPSHEHLVAAMLMWVITGPGLVLFFHAVL